MAQSVIGALRVNLGLDSAQFARGARQAETRAQKLGRALTRLSVVGAAAGGAFLALARRSALLVDDQAKLALSLGTTTASIQTLQRAGELAGVSFGEIQQATLQLTRRLSQAAAGAGPAVASLDALRLSAQQLQALPLDERIALIQDRIAEFIPAAEQAAVASTLFGDRAGLVFTRIDSATLRQANEELRDFGVLVDDVDAGQIQRTNDALSALGLITQGIGNQIAVALAPALERMAAGFREATREGTLFSNAVKVIAGNADLLVKALGALAALIGGRLVLSAGRAAIALAGLFGPVGLAIAAVGTLGAFLGVLANKMGIFGGSAEDTKEPVELLNDALRDFAETRAPAAAARAIDLANANYQVAASAVDAARAEIAKGRALIAAGESGSGRSARGQVLGGERLVRQGEAELAAAEQALADAAANRQRAITAVTTQTEFNIDVSEAAVGITDELAESTDRFSGSAGGAAANVQALTAPVEGLTDAMEGLAVTGEDVRKGLAGVFTDAIQGVTGLSQGLSQLAAQFANRLLNRGFEQLFGLISGGGGGGFSFKGIGKLLGFATGTPYAPGGLAMVGERGPELVDLPRGSRVFNAERTRQMMEPQSQPTPSVALGGVRIVNVLDPSLIGDFINTAAGEQAIINIMQRVREST